MRKRTTLLLVIILGMAAAFLLSCTPRDLVAELDDALPGITPTAQAEAAGSDNLPTKSNETTNEAQGTYAPEIIESPSSAQATNDTGSSWTVLIYMCGTDLETLGGAASANIAEMLEADIGGDVNLVIQTGGTRYWHNNTISPNAIQRYKVDNGELNRVYEHNLVSMGISSTLSSFLSWGVKKYPADKYMALIWNHGGGVLSGVAFDEMFANDSLTLIELESAFKAAETHFEIIGLDCCLMASIETAQIFQPYANYMIASQEYEPIGGWNYKEWLTYLSMNPDLSGENIGRRICDTYYKKCENDGYAPMATLSVVDLDKLPALSDAFTLMAREMCMLTSNIGELKSFTQEALKSENYGSNNNDDGYTNLVDLGDLAMNVQGVIGDAGNDVIDALYEAVTYNVKGKNRNASNGLSVFFPLKVTGTECAVYAGISKDAAYLGFIDALSSDWSAPAWVSAENSELGLYTANSEDYDIRCNVSVDGGNAVLKITNGLDAVKSVLFDLYYMDYNSGQYILFGRDSNISADWENGVFHSNFDGSHLTLNGVYCAPSLIAQNEYYDLFSIPILLNGEKTNLRLSKDKTSGVYENLGVWEGIDSATGISGRETGFLKTGDIVSPLFYAYKQGSSNTNTYTIGSFTVGGELRIERQAIIDGDYLIRFEVEDVFLQTYFSDAVKVECRNGNISIG